MIFATALTQKIRDILTCTPLAQIERLAYLEAHAYFLGELKRKHVMDRFGVAQVQASRDVSLYRQITRHNLDYDPSAKRYFPTSSFNRLFVFPVGEVLQWLGSGRGDGLHHPSGVATELLPRPGLPKDETLALLTRAIYRGKAIRLDYISLSRGSCHRQLVPHALADSGLRWHVRAYDRDNQRFGDFVINRMSNIELLDAPPTADELSSADKQWQEEIDLRLIPHPRIAHGEVIAADYGMSNGELVLHTRAAMAGYLLRRWNVDISKNHQLTDEGLQLALANPDILLGIDSAKLAPGYLGTV